MNPQETQTGYSLHTDPITEAQYLRIPIADLNDLSYLQHSLLECMLLITRHEQDHPANRHCIFWITKILQAGYPDMELERLGEF